MPTITANELRFLAESADGDRDVPLCLVVDGGDVKVVKKADVGTRQVLLDLVTGSRGPGVAPGAKVRVFWQGHVYGGGKLDDADALFVSQSSIEKFLLPYYMRFRSAAMVQALENKLFNDREVVAAYHIPPSVTYGFKPPIVGVLKPKPNSDEFTDEQF